MYSCICRTQQQQERKKNTNSIELIMSTGYSKNA
jgi:hypothetical protein